MVSSAAAFGRRLAVAWVDRVRRHAVLVCVLAVAATVAAGVYVVENMAINTDTDGMLSQDLPFQKESKALARAFPQFSDNIVVVVDGQTPDLADDAAVALGAAMRARPKVFEHVFDPAGDPFFRQNGLLYMSVDDLNALSDRLAEAQPFLGKLWHDPSLRGLFGMLGLAVDETLKAGADKPPIAIDRVLKSIAATLEAQAAGRFADLSWQSLMYDTGDDAGPHRRFVLIQPVLDYGSLQPAATAIATVRDLAGGLGLTPDHGVRVRMTGAVAMSEDELMSVEQGMGVAGLVSLVVVIALLFICFRSARLAVATLVTLIMGLVWTAAFALLAIGTLNLISVAFAVLFIGLSVDFGIHFGLRARESLAAGASHEESLREAAESVGGALTLCAVAAAIAFFSFLPTAYRGLAELGVIAGAGMFIALFSNLTVLPALITVMPLRRPKAIVGQGAEVRVPVLARLAAHPRAVVSGALIVAALCALVVPRARFDFDPLNLRDPRTESVATYLDLVRSSENGPYSADILAKNINYAKELSKKLNELMEVRKAESIVDYIPTGQDEKLDVIGTMALFLAPSLASGASVPRPTDAETRAALEEITGKLAALRARFGTAPLGREAGRLADALAALGGSKASDSTIADMSNRLLTALPRRLEMLRSLLDAEPVTLDTLPADLRSRSVAADGRARIEVYPSEDLTNRDNLRRFVGAVREVAPHVTGGPVTILEAGDAVVTAFAEAATIAILCIVVLLVVVLRNARDVVFVFSPLVLATLLTVTASVVLRLPFNFANVIVLPLLFGLGVANGIHVVMRGREEAGGGRVFATSTPRAVVFSALTTIGSFGSIALSSHPGTASMGILLTIAITFSLICTLVLLPALMALWGPTTRRGDVAGGGT